MNRFFAFILIALISLSITACSNSPSETVLNGNDYEDVKVQLIELTVVDENYTQYNFIKGCVLIIAMAEYGIEEELVGLNHRYNVMVGQTPRSLLENSLSAIDVLASKTVQWSVMAKKIRPRIKEALANL